MSSLFAIATSTALGGGVITAFHQLDDPDQALHFIIGCMAGAGFTIVLERMIFPLIVPLVRYRRRG